jgi:hypothetical protein
VIRRQFVVGRIRGVHEAFEPDRFLILSRSKAYCCEQAGRVQKPGEPGNCHEALRHAMPRILWRERWKDKAAHAVNSLVA